MKISKLLLVLVLLGGFLFTACEKENFYEDNGSDTVKNVKTSLPDGSDILYYDASNLQTATLTVSQGNEGSVGAATVRKRINTGQWFDHSSIGSFPSTMELSLDDVLSGTGLTLDDVAAGDVVEIAFFLDGEYLNGHTTIPITCSTDVVVSNQTAEAFSPVDGAAATLSFDLAKDDGPTEISSVDITSTYDGNTVTLQSVSLPSNVNIVFGDVLDAHGLVIDDLEIGDVFDISFILNSGVSCNSAQVLGIPYGCPSNLAGTYNAVTTVNNQGAGIDWDACEGNTWEGTIRFETKGPGVYDIFSVSTDGVEFNDMSFGAYSACYGSDQSGHPNGTLEFVEVCGKLSVNGLSQWDESYTVTGVEVDGATLTYSWTNDYGEGASTVLTRTDGTNWPDGLTN